jgi:molybdate transport system substrate-binding protein
MNVSDVLSRVVSEEQDVKGVIGKVALGEADAGFVYATDIGPVRDKVRAFDLPARERPGVSYMVAILRDAPHAASGRAFVAKLLGANGRRALAAAGFGLP